MILEIPIKLALTRFYSDKGYFFLFTSPHSPSHLI